MPNQDKLHITATEHAATGGYKAPVHREFARLPYTCCCLTLAPWGANPVCAVAPSTGHVYLFDLLALVPYVRRHGKHPVSGDPLSGKDIVKLKFTRNGEGAYVCAASGKVFGDSTKIAAVRTSGQVYSYDALETLCLAPKSLKDLVDGTPFTRSDVLVLQDSADPAWLHAHRTSHIRSAREQHAGGAAAAAAAAAGEVANSGGGVIRLSEVARSVLAELPTSSLIGAPPVPDAAAAATASTAAAAAAAAAASSATATTTTHHAASLTSSAVPLTSRILAAPATAATAAAARWARIAALGKKGLVRLVTRLGPLSLELHCDLAPRTCENFLRLAAAGAYDGTLLHRNIPGFMVQGGDPTGTGRGGASAYGAPFADEFHAQLGHSARGVLSMANSGPNSNGSQFFLTYAPCGHLDRKHSVFGRLVGGEAVLGALEKLPVDSSDRPREEVRVLRVEVFSDPTREVEEGGGGGLSVGSRGWKEGLESVRAPVAAAAAVVAVAVAVAAAVAAVAAVAVALVGMCLSCRARVGVLPVRSSSARGPRRAAGLTLAAGRVEGRHAAA